MYLHGLREWAVDGKSGFCDIVVTNAGKNINLLAKKAVEKNSGSVITKKKYRSRKGENIMPVTIKLLLDQYIEILQKIYGNHLKTVILYGSYARGDYKADSDIDIMILLDLSDMDIKQYRHELSGETFDFNMDHGLDIKPIAKSQQHFQNWVDVYPFYANVKKEGVKLFDAA